MTIRSDIKKALAGGPLSIEALAEVTGHAQGSIINACNYMHADGAIRKSGNAYALAVIKTPPPQINRLTLPAYVPPKVLHRPHVDAPGMLVRRYLTGERL